jgi:hypothetical protein
LFYWFGFVCFANKNKKFSCHTADSKPVKQEVNGTVILPPLVFPASTIVSGLARQKFGLQQSGQAYSCLCYKHILMIVSEACTINGLLALA